MKTILQIFIALILFSPSITKAQDLSKHQWKNRLLLVLTENTNNQEFQDQIKELQKNKSGLEDRKLIIYQITPNKYRVEFSEDKEWIKRPELYQDLKTKNKSFEVVLIGLDGGEKLRQNHVITIGKLFSIIDGMPMRRAEIKRNE